MNKYLKGYQKNPSPSSCFASSSWMSRLICSSDTDSPWRSRDANEKLSSNGAVHTAVGPILFQSLFQLGLWLTLGPGRPGFPEGPCGPGAPISPCGPDMPIIPVWPFLPGGPGFPGIPGSPDCPLSPFVPGSPWNRCHHVCKCLASKNMIPK